MYKSALITAFLILPFSAFSSESSIEGGRWVPSGTFAISNYPNNQYREKSYSNSGNEKNRLSTFLPGMTIVYQAIPSSIRQGYMEGVTHSGIPVQVLETDLSKGIFSDRSAKDVVVHRSHNGCKTLACDGDPLEVGIGHAFRIYYEDEQKIELINTNELKTVYSKSKFNELEKNGYLTRHKGRENPRWSIYDGYAGHVSTSCGERIEASAFELEVPTAHYSRPPSEWSLNDDAWSIKAVELFDLGKVLKDSQNDGITTSARLISSLEDQKGQGSAIDFTIFAYRDSSWMPENFKFAGLLQIINCDESPVGNRSTPTYVKEAYLYFDKTHGENDVQALPLTPHELPRQYTESAQEKIHGYINRSFFYSINSPQDYAYIFEKLSNIIPFPTAVANVIARLNGSCAQSDREKCREYSGQ